MTPGTSPWRVSDAVAYEILRDVASRTTALLVASDSGFESERSAEAAEIQRALRVLNGFDRVAVDLLSEQLRERVAQIEATS